MKGYVILFLVLAFFISATSAWAGKDKSTNEELLEEIRVLKAKVAVLEAKVIKLEAEPEKKQPPETAPPAGSHKLFEGLNIGAGATFVVQGTIDANNAGGKGEDVTDASYSVDLELEKEFDDWGLAFVHLETGDGAGVEDELEVFSNVNRDADDANNSVSLTEAWYEHNFFDRQLALTAGKIDPTCYVDQNEIANDECTQFLGRIFRNAPTIDFTDNNAGVHTLISPAEAQWLGLEGQILDGDGDWEDIADNVFIAGQVNLKPTFQEGLSGNYRVYAWYKDTPYTKWADPNNIMDEDKYGFGASIDQQLTDIFTVFSRYGWADPDFYDPNITSSSGANYSLEHTWSAGFKLNGAPWGREQDHFAAAVGMAIPSDKYKDAGANRKADDEGHIEAYYSWQINEHLTLSPDIQVIWNPFGDDCIVNNERRDDTITVIGCRGQVDF